MKHIQYIWGVLFIAFGLSACSVDRSAEVLPNKSPLAIQLLPAAKPAYGSSTRVTVDGGSWSEGDVVFAYVVLYADDAMTNEVSSVYTAMRYDADGNWVAARGSIDGTADFSFKTEADANNPSWSTSEVIAWPNEGVRKAEVKAIYAGQHPTVGFSNEGNAQIWVNASRVGLSEILTSTRSLLKSDLSTPVKLVFSHRLTRLDFGTELSSAIQIKSGGFGSGVGIIPLSIDFAGKMSSDNTLELPVGKRYVYITIDNMMEEKINRVFRFQDPVSGALIGAFSLPETSSEEASNNPGYYYGHSYTLVPKEGGSVKPDEMLP